MTQRVEPLLRNVIFVILYKGLFPTESVVSLQSCAQIYTHKLLQCMHALIFGFCWIRSCRIGHSCCGTSIEQHRCAPGQKKKTGLTRISLCDTPASTIEKLKWSQPDETLRMAPSNTTNFSFAEKLLEMSETKKNADAGNVFERGGLHVECLCIIMTTNNHRLGCPSRVLEILVLCVLRQTRMQFMHELRGGLARLFLSSVASKLSARILCSHTYKTITWTWQFPVQDLQKEGFLPRSQNSIKLLTKMKVFRKRL